MASKQVEFLVKICDACQMKADALNAYMQSVAPSEIELTAVQELTFTTMKFEGVRSLFSL